MWRSLNVAGIVPGLIVNIMIYIIWIWQFYRVMDISWLGETSNNWLSAYHE